MDLRPQWFERFDAFVTILVFLDLICAVYITPAHAQGFRILLFSLAGVGLIVMVVARRLRALRFVADVIPKFSFADNRDVWRLVDQEYAYIGVSGDSFFQLFCNARGKGLLPSGRIRFLMLHPDRECVRESKRHELGREPSDDEVKMAAERIVNCARQYIALGVEVHFYEAYARYWAHFVDDSEAYIGYLLQGQSGLEGPVLRLRRGHRHNPLLKHFHQEFERLWGSATDAATYLRS